MCRLKPKSQNSIFAHITKNLDTPAEYCQRNCFIGASFPPKHKIVDRHNIGAGKLMWGPDYPHMEGTWPRTQHLNGVFDDIPEDETKLMLGESAADLFGFDREALRPIQAQIGPTVADIRG